MSAQYTYWQDHGDGMWLGYWNDYPDCQTEGATHEELKRMLISLRADIREMIADGTMPETPSFMKCHGILDHGAAEELRAVQADFSKVEPELWRLRSSPCCS